MMVTSAGQPRVARSLSTLPPRSTPKRLRTGADGAAAAAVSSSSLSPGAATASHVPTDPDHINVPVPADDEDLYLDDVFVTDAGDSKLPTGCLVRNGGLAMDEAWLARETSEKTHDCGGERKDDSRKESRAQKLLRQRRAGVHFSTSWRARSGCDSTVGAELEKPRPMEAYQRLRPGWCCEAFRTLMSLA